ncbi:transcriptional regulator family: Fungal Specific TF [Paecilomyces variotii]|nr:transcriptional regulator family: Fungal Specific TF [Paecilomyces variotii]KAJ9231353.1 transcriptional regulator family: Fungal Specific TF [Paecilomyces variotii]KAJ9248541.1 transcriptional regulator family: Fungal Specific TF [Paecilomyces variotii]KAJ9256252.1 transcriptional regulator family: Fungal Specific TF [Paecilomyces variotii]KAJ9287836.1 transcriptional regulator family: Fungal Specific TF [Paecilomyces variotii]
MPSKVLAPNSRSENSDNPANHAGLAPLSSSASVVPERGSPAEDDHRSNKRSAATRPPSKLEWVHSDVQTVAGGQTQENRRIVRSHVMAEHRRKKRLQDLERYQKTRFNPLSLRLVQRPSQGQRQASVAEQSPEILSDASGPSDIDSGRSVPLPWVYRVQDNAPEDGENQILPAKKGVSSWPNPSIWSPVGQGSGDPFATMATNLRGRMQGHLHYFVNEVVPMSYPLRSANRFRLQAGWGPLAQANAVLLHSMISVACTVYAMWTGEYLGPDMALRSPSTRLSLATLDSFYHKSETIRLVNEKLNDPEQAAADATIAAVAILITVETLTGDIDQVRIHLNGLRQMIALRGDLSSLPLTVVSQIATTDVKISIVGLTKPIFPFVKPIRRTTKAIPAADADIARIASNLLTLPDPSVLFSPNMMQVFHDLAEMTRYAELVRRRLPTGVEDNDEDFFDTQNLFIEYRLLSYRFDPITEEFVGDNTIEGCCRLAALLYVNTVLWVVYTSAAAVLHVPVKALKVALETLDESIRQTFWAPYSDLLAWVLFLGAHCSKDQIERPFFIVELAKVVISSGWRDVEEMRQRLMGFFYVDRMYGASLVEVWDEVQTVISRWK